MEFGKFSNVEHSTELQSALERFEDVCHLLENEHNKLLELEKRRQKLNDDLERLRSEIKEEKNYFQSVIDEPFVKEIEDDNQICSIQKMDEEEEPNPIDTDAIKQYIVKQRQEIVEEFQEIEREAEEAPTKLLSQDLDDVEFQYILDDSYEIHNVTEHSAEDSYFTSEEN